MHKKETIYAYELIGDNGFFVEAGASRGDDKCSSCYPLVQHGWHGVCVEPFKEWYDLLVKARPESKCYNVALGEHKGTEEFFHCDNHWLSGIKSKLRESTLLENGTVERVSVVTLPDLLREADAPKKIDWIALDTEGSEPGIIKTFLLDGEFECDCISSECPIWKDKEVLDILKAKNYKLVKNPPPCDNFWVR